MGSSTTFKFRNYCEIFLLKKFGPLQILLSNFVRFLLGRTAMLPTLHSLMRLFFIQKVISNGTVQQRELSRFLRVREPKLHEDGKRSYQEW
jgi:hypothetical protein